MTLRLRLIAGYTTLVTLTIVALLVAVRLLMEHAALHQLEAHHAAEAAEFAQLLHDMPEGAKEDGCRRHMQLDSGLYKFFLHTPEGRIIHRSEALAAVAPAYLLAVPDGRAELGGALGECRITTHNIEGYRLRVITPLSVPLSVTASFYEIGALLLLIGLIGSPIAATVYARWALRPLVRMEETARNIGRGSTNLRIPADIVNAGDEPARLAALLNDGYDRMQASVDRLRRFSAEVSHELRTPLSIVRLNAERIRDTAGTPASVQELAGEQIVEIERLNRFITNLLGYSRLDAGAVHMDIKPVPLASWLGDFAEDAKLLCEDAGRHYVLDTPPDLIARFDPVWIRNVLFNLLSNSIRVTPPGGTIRLAVVRTESALLLRQTDEGPGLPPERLESVFNRYVRFGEETGPAEGVGLGLAICKSVAELHGGRIHAENNPDGKGLTVTVTLPQFDEDLA